MKKWRLIAIISSIVLVAAVAVTLIVIFTSKDKEEYKYPTVQPTISDADRAYAYLGNKVVTREDLYLSGLINYGLSTLIDLMDEEILDVTYTEEQYKEHKEGIFSVYNDIDLEEVDLENPDQIKGYEEEMIKQGYHTAKAREDALILDLKRTLHTEKLFKEYIAAFKPVVDEKTNEVLQPIYYTTTQIDAVIEATYPTESDVIYLVFRSENEALNLMRENDIDTSKLYSGWIHLSTGQAFTKEEVIATYEKMYRELNGLSNEVTDIAKTYTNTSLSEVNKTIASKVFNTLEAIDEAENIKNSYMAKPEKYLTNYYYLAVRLTKEVQMTSEQFIKDYQANSTDEKFKKVNDTLFDNVFTSAVINSFLYYNRYSNGAKIYLESLDAAFQSSCNSAMTTYYKDLSYSLTTEESKDYVAVLGDKTITADELCDALIERYGPVIMSEYINRYVLFSDEYSSVYNYETNTTLKDFDMYKASSIDTLKNSLENGELTDYGFPASYGWENFVVDYFGTKEENQIIMISDAYEDALNTLINSVYTTHTDTVEGIYQMFLAAYRDGTKTIAEYEAYLETLNKETYENTVTYQMIKDFTEFFNVYAGILSYYYDEDFNGTADEISATTSSLGNDLIEAIYYLADNNFNTPDQITGTKSYQVLAKSIFTAIKDGKYSPYTSISGDTTEERIEKLVNIYNISTINDKVFGTYKDAGLRLKLTKATSYSNVTAGSEIGKILKDTWNQISNGTLLLKDGSYAKFAYADDTNSAVNAKNAIGISPEAPYRVDAEYTFNHTTGIVYITQATNSTWYTYTAEYQELFPVLGDGKINVEYFEKLIRYYLLKLEDAATLTEEEANFLSSMKKPSTFQTNYLTNLYQKVHDYIYGDDVTEELLLAIREKLITEKEVKFVKQQDLDNFTQLMKLIKTEEE